MNTKKFFIAVAIFGGVLFTAQATNIIDLNEQTKEEVKKNTPRPPHG